MKHAIFTPLLLSGLLLLGTHVSAENQPAPSIEELWRIIQAQQAEIEALKQQQAETEQKATAADTKAEAAVVAVESLTDAMSVVGIVFAVGLVFRHSNAVCRCSSSADSDVDVVGSEIGAGSSRFGPPTISQASSRSGTATGSRRRRSAKASSCY